MNPFHLALDLLTACAAAMSWYDYGRTGQARWAVFGALLLLALWAPWRSA